jgi:hypothetical protein
VTALSRNPDLALLALALPIFAVAGLPLVAWVTAAVLWLAWRGIGEWTDRMATNVGGDRPGKFAGIMTGSVIGRGWLVAVALIIVGLSTDNRTGLSATVLLVILFTSSFVVRLTSRPTHQASSVS